MKLLLGLCLALALLLMTGTCSAQKPRRCRTPPLLSGSMSVSARDGKDWAVAKYRYDAFGQRIRLWEIGRVQNKSFHVNMLFLFREVKHKHCVELQSDSSLNKLNPLKYQPYGN